MEQLLGRYLLLHAVPRLAKIGYVYNSDWSSEQDDLMHVFTASLGQSILLIQFLRLDQRLLYEESGVCRFTINLKVWPERLNQNLGEVILQYYGIRIPTPFVVSIWGGIRPDAIGWEFTRSNSEQAAVAINQALDLLEEYGIPWLESRR